MNKKLDGIPEYRGSIGDVDLSLYRGAYRIEDIRSPQVDIRIDKIEALAPGLTNRPDGDGNLPASLHAIGKAMGKAHVSLNLKLDPLSPEPAFDMDGQLNDLELSALNDFLKAYAGLDAEGKTRSQPDTPFGKPG